MSATFEWSKAKAEGDYLNNYLDLHKPVDGENLKAYEYHEVKPLLYYGVAHYEPLPSRRL